MERLEFDNSEHYRAIEGAIHINRYLLVKRICEGKKILDVACGEGYGSYLLSKWGAASVHGVDISEIAINNAKSNFSSEGISFLCKNVENMQNVFESKSFDMIVSFETIEHLQNPVSFLNELKRLIKPDGIIIISCPNDYYYYPTEDMSNPFHVKKYTMDDFKELTQQVLGKANEYFVGTHLHGFVNIKDGSLDLINAPKSDQTKMLQYKSNIDSFLLPRDEDINTNNCSYFVGIWGEHDNKLLETFVAYPRAMDQFSTYAYPIFDLTKNAKDLVCQQVELHQMIESLNSYKKENMDLQLKLEKENRDLQLKIEALQIQKDQTMLRLEALQAQEEFLQTVIAQSNKERIQELENELSVIYESNGYKFLRKWYGVRDKMKAILKR